MKNIGNMLKQAKEMQAKMEDLQKQAEEAEQTGVSGGGMITATVNGKGMMRALKIDPSLVSSDEVEVLEDLIIAAVNDAKGKAEAAMAENMKNLTGGLNLPAGMKLPF